MPPGGSCLLGSINLSAFVDEKTFDFDSFEEAVKISVEGLNDVLIEGMDLHPLEEQRESVNKWRQIGLGIFGLADMLIKMEITYGSDEAIELCDKIGYIMASTALKASNALAKRNGAFKECNIKEIMHTSFFENNAPDSLADFVDYGIANSQLLTIAPTGTLSTMLGVSGGIEPVFANYYTRKTQSLFGEDVYYKVYTPIVEEYMKAHGINDDDELPEWFITAQELDYRKRIDMQAIWQKHIDASISSTVNLPNETTVEDVFNLYLLAWEKGLKGITIYRDGCMRSGVLITDNTKTEIKEDNKPKRGEILKVNDTLIGLKRKLNTGCGSMYCCPYYNTDGEMQEIFLSKGSSGVCLSFMTALGRLISLCLRGGISQDDIVDQLLSIPACPSYVGKTATAGNTSKGKNCPSAIAYSLIEMTKQFKDINNGNFIAIDEKEETKTDSANKKICPLCGEELHATNGCWSCSCGYSKCD